MNSNLTKYIVSYERKLAATHIATYRDRDYARGAINISAPSVSERSAAIHAKSITATPEASSAAISLTLCFIIPLAMERRAGLDLTLKTYWDIDNIIQNASEGDTSWN